MTVLDLLAREHLIFRRILDIIQEDLVRPEESARLRMGAALLTILPALDRHEELEEIIFRRSPYVLEAIDKELQAEIETQHNAIAWLRVDILNAIEASDRFPFERLKILATLLVGDLRKHLETEEKRLWPHYRDFVSRSLDRALVNQVHKRAEILEAGLAEGLMALTETSPQDR